ncbi:MAG: ABC transporter substrate-binding protein [Synergistaceae bacterium]|nr:ABC transporter substrate-binding protein [Synergistaceae bacterium]
MSKSRVVIIALVVIVIAFISISMQKKTEPQNDVASSGSSEPSEEHILRVGWTAEADILNPLTSWSTEAMQITYLVYEPLIGYNTDLEIVGKLARSFETSEDGLTITYKLRPNAKWHDGEPVTADDVIYTHDIIRETGYTNVAQFAEFWESVTAADDHTVVVKLTQPLAFNYACLMPIMPKHIWDGKDGDEIALFANEEPIGSGPYRFVKWEKGSTISLVRNTDYDGTQPGPDGVLFVLYGNEDVAVQALKAGELDVIMEVPPTVWEGIKDVANVKAISLDSYSLHEIGINVAAESYSKGHPFLRDIAVRRAMRHALDTKQMVEIVLGGHGDEGDSLIPFGLKEWHYEFKPGERMGFDLENANRILDEAGYKMASDGVREKDGKKMEFRLMAVEANATDVRGAQLYRDACAKIGIKLTLSTMDENTMGDIVYNKDAPDWDVFMWAWDSDYPDPAYMLGVMLTSQIGVGNEVYYSNPKYDDLYKQQLAELDHDKRKAIIDEMQKMFYDDNCFLVTWYQDKLQAYRTDTFTGWKEVTGGIIYGVTYDNYIDIQPVK